MSETIPFTEAKAQLSQLVDQVDREHERIVITKNGRPAAVMIAPDDLEALEETLEILSDARTMGSIRTSLAEHEQGKGRKLSEVYPAGRRKR